MGERASESGGAPHEVVRAAAGHVAARAGEALDGREVGLAGEDAAQRRAAAAAAALAALAAMAADAGAAAGARVEAEHEALIAAGDEERAGERHWKRPGKPQAAELQLLLRTVQERWPASSWSRPSCGPSLVESHVRF